MLAREEKTQNTTNLSNAYTLMIPSKIRRSGVRSSNNKELQQVVVSRETIGETSHSRYHPVQNNNSLLLLHRRRWRARSQRPGLFCLWVRIIVRWRVFLGD